jgi:TetR/AcrR family transcriptional regulator
MTDRGLNSITTKELARQNGISEAAIYRHFASKHEIFMALLDGVEKDLFQTIGKAADSQRTALDKLRAIMQAHMNFTQKHKGGIFVITAECIHMRDRAFKQKLLGVIGRYIETIKGILVQAKKDNTVNQDIDIESASMMFYSLIQVAAINYVLTDYKVKPISRFKTMWYVFIRGVERDERIKTVAMRHKSVRLRP